MITHFFFAILMFTQAFAGLNPDQIDSQIEKMKPRPSDSVEQAAKKCSLLAREGERRGVKVLLVGIEGDGGFRADNAWQVYRYLWRITHDKSDSPPELDTAAPVLHRLLLPLIDYYNAKVEVLNFPETAVRSKEMLGVMESTISVPEVCVAAWMARKDDPRVILFGHSYGGDAIYDLSTALAWRRIKIDQAYSLDPVPRIPGKHFQKPENVEHWFNFYVVGAGVYGAEVNRNLYGTGLNHRTIVRSTPVMDTVKTNLQVP